MDHSQLLTVCMVLIEDSSKYDAQALKSPLPSVLFIDLAEATEELATKLKGGKVINGFT